MARPTRRNRPSGVWRRSSGPHDPWTVRRRGFFGGPSHGRIYARASTQDQNCEMHVRELREYAVRRGWQVVGEYVDTGWSGAKASRPELDHLMKDAALRRFDVVMVWKLDRFGRSVRNCLDGIEALRAHGVRFLAVSQSIDTDESNPTARLLPTSWRL